MKRGIFFLACTQRQTATQAGREPRVCDATIISQLRIMSFEMRLQEAYFIIMSFNRRVYILLF